VTADELRSKAANLRAMSKGAADEHVLFARLLSQSTSASDRIAFDAQASVADCMARRYGQWARHLEAAALEVEEEESKTAPPA
jgi:hypothetical protein